jgi:hypothetical protein
VRPKWPGHVRVQTGRKTIRRSGNGCALVAFEERVHFRQSGANDGPYSTVLARSISARQCRTLSVARKFEL